MRWISLTGAVVDNVVRIASDLSGRGLVVGVGCGCALAACGSASQSEVQPAPPLTAQSVSVRQTGDAAARIATSTITYQLDDSGALVVRVNVQSQSATPQTITARASFFDAKGNLVGDATGGQIAVAPGATAALQLNGPAPTGTIAGTVFEVSNVASPTPTSTTPVPTGTPSRSGAGPSSLRTYSNSVRPAARSRSTISLTR